MRWTEDELVGLQPLLERIARDVGDAHDVLVVCSAEGDLAFLLADRLPAARIVGTELAPDALAAARRRSRATPLGERVEFRPAELTRIPLPDASFDAIISDFVVFPTSAPTEFGQPEMARVLRPGGRLVLTDVIGPSQVEGLDYVCEATFDDFRSWMNESGFEEVEVDDVTSLVRPLWAARGSAPPVSYIYVRGMKPPGVRPRLAGAVGAQ